MKETAIDGLIGQANLKLAHGKSEEALALLHEAIRQDPRNVELYFQVSNIYSDLDRLDECFKYRHLAANLNSKTSADEWNEVGLMALTLERLDEAAACYEKAIRLDPSNWSHYEKRIEVLEALGHTDAAMKTRLKAAQSISSSTSNVSFEWLKGLIEEVAEHYKSRDNEDRAMDALEALVLRSCEFGQRGDEQHLVLIDKRLARGRFDDCVKSILTLQPGIRALDEQGEPAFKSSWSGAGGCVLQPYPLPNVQRWLIEACFPSEFLSRLIVALIRLERRESAQQLVNHLLERNIQADEEVFVLHIAEAYQSIDAADDALQFITTLLESGKMAENADAWYILGSLSQARDDTETARKAYEKVIKFRADHVDAKVNLSEILQKLGKSDEALAILSDCSLATCSHLPNEKLLKRQADVLLERRLMDQYVVCVRLLLIPYFYSTQRHMAEANVSSRRNRVINSLKISGNVANPLRKLVYQGLQGSPYQKMIERLGEGIAESGASSSEPLTGKELHDYALRLAERFYIEERFDEMSQVVGYAFLDFKIAQTGLSTFKNLLFFTAIKTGNMPLAFEFTRFHYSYSQSRRADFSSKGEHYQKIFYARLYNAMNYVLCNYQSSGDLQNVAYHRFVIRALGKKSDHPALRVISGNNSLITGSYRHALGEFYRVWLDDKDDPLLCLMVALTFTHMACKKSISSRLMLVIRALALMKRYQSNRGEEVQEVDYNIGRFFHQTGVLPKAVYFYERVLNSPAPTVLGMPREQTGRYDLKRLAAYNLSLIYDESGNQALAREVLEKHCSI